MAIFARGTAKTVAIAPELVSFGTQGAGPGQFLRRTSSDLNLQVQQIESQEILPSQQIRDSRPGPRQTQGTLSGQLSPASYKLLFEGLLRGTFSSGAFTPSTNDNSATVDANGNLVLSSASAGFITSGLRLGDMVRVSQPNNAGINFRIISLTPTVATMAPINGVATPFSGGATNVTNLNGKKLIVPPGPAQVDRSFTIEHWYSDVGRSEVFLGTKVSQIALNIPSSGFVTFQASLTGQNMIETGTQAYPGALPASGSTSLTAVSGRVIYQGSTLAYLTGMNLQLATQVQAPTAVGSNYVPAIFVSQIMARGSVTALFTTDSMTNDFLNETEVGLSVTMTTNPLASADFISLYMPRVRLTSSTKSDSPAVISRSYNFVALEHVSGASNTDATTIVVQDSLV